MARYLIGTGARNWNSTAIWSDVSGGTGGFSVPTSADPVILDQNSGTGDLTLDVNAVCGSLNSSALTGIVTVKGSVFTLSNYGDLTLNQNYSKFLLTGTSYYFAKGTGTITTNGNLFLALNRFYIDGVGITVTHADNFTADTTTPYHVNGTWNHGNYNITTLGYTFVAGTKTLTMGGGVFDTKTGSVFFHTSAGLTFNRGTGTIKNQNVYPGVGLYLTGYYQFHNIETTILSIDLNIGVPTIVENLTVIGSNRVDQSIGLSRMSELRINNVLTIRGYNSTNNRLLVYYNTTGTACTITVNGSIVASNVDFRDITLAGTANRDLSAITGGSGDCGGNSGITFTPAVPQYYKHTGGGTTLWSDAKWYSDAALTVAGRVPLPQDDANFIAGSFSAPCTLSVNCPRIGRSLDMSGVGYAVTMSLANAIECYGSYVLGANITPSGNYTLYLYGRTDHVLNTYNKTIYAIYFVGYNSLCTLQSNLITNGLIGAFYNFKVDFNDNNVTCNYNTFIFGSASGENNFLWLGNGIITFNSNTASGFQIRSTVTVYPELSTIKLNTLTSANNVTVSLSGKIFNIVHFSGSHTGNYDIYNSSTFNRLIIDKGRKVRFTAGTNQTIGDMVIGDNVTITSPTNAQHTLTYTGGKPIQAKFANISYSKVLPQNKWWAGASVDGGNNTNWRFAFFGKGINYLNGTRVIQALRAKK